jgi:hypothetical protein
MIHLWLNVLHAEPQPIQISDNYHDGQHLLFSELKIELTIPSGWTGSAEKMGLLLFSGESTLIVESAFYPDDNLIWETFEQPLQLHEQLLLLPFNPPQRTRSVKAPIDIFQQSYRDPNWNAELIAMRIDDGRLLKVLAFGPVKEQSLQKEAISAFAENVLFQQLSKGTKNAIIEPAPLPEGLLFEKVWIWQPHSERIIEEKLHLCSNHTFILGEEHRRGNVSEYDTLRGTWELKGNSLSLYTDGLMRYMELGERNGKITFQKVSATSSPSKLCQKE